MGSAGGQPVWTGDQRAGRGYERVLERVKDAGGTVVRAPLERPWGIYAGYFSDPDGHLWEVVYFLHGNRPN